MISDYIKIARPDHWFKNMFVFPGVLLGWLACPPEDFIVAFGHVFVGLVATCLICSSNYTINELLDAPTDRKHPEKKHRPAAAGRIKKSWAYLQWVSLSLSGLFLARYLGWAFFIVALSLLIMGVVYNVKPLRSKDIPYLDVLTEAINNPIRLLLGWYAAKCQLTPPASLLLSYWMLGAFFMAVKRYAELRHIGDSIISAAYRKSFAHYTEDRLLISIVFYSSTFAFFSGVFLIKYRVELILAIPFYAGFMSFYIYLGLLPDSPAQHPESLFKHKVFTTYSGIIVVITAICFFLRVPWLGQLFESTIPAGF